MLRAHNTGPDWIRLTIWLLDSTICPSLHEGYEGPSNGDSDIGGQLVLNSLWISISPWSALRSFTFELDATFNAREQ